MVTSALVTIQNCITQEPFRCDFPVEPHIPFLSVNNSFEQETLDVDASHGRLNTEYVYNILDTTVDFFCFVYLILNPLNVEYEWNVFITKKV